MKQNESLVTVATFATSLEASLARGALESAGIPAFVPDEALGTFSRNRGGLPEGVLQVLESDRDRAIAELRRINLQAGLEKKRTGT